MEKVRCACEDPGCPTGHGDVDCGITAKHRMFRIDMEDQTGTPMCDGCAEDADDSGLFRHSDEDAR